MGASGPGRHDLGLGDLTMTTEEMPVDYEECGECGYDHSYEPHEAREAHGALRMAKAMEEIEEMTS